MAKPKILLTRRWPEAVEARLSAAFDTTLNIGDVPMTPADFQDAFTKYDAVLPTVTDNLGAESFDVAAPRTRFLGNYGVGFSHVDMASAARLRICVSNTPDVLSDCTADLAMTLLLMAARRAGEGERELRAGDWTGWRPTHLVGTKVFGKTLGIIGFGRIGQAMARRAHFGFGMKIIVQNRSQIAADVLSGFGATQVETVDALLQQCDFVSLHCPGGDVNRGLINADRLGQMRDGAILINTARGEVVDDTALAAALQEGRIGGAALDVFDGEPIVNPTLAASPRLVMLPHLGSATRETREAMGNRVYDNVTDFFAGRAPRDQVS